MYRRVFEMRLFKILIEYFRGNLIIVSKKEGKRFYFYKGSNVDKKFILNSLMEIIRLNI